jgi:hypothetical protein
VIQGLDVAAKTEDRETSGVAANRKETLSFDEAVILGDPARSDPPDNCDHRINDETPNSAVLFAKTGEAEKSSVGANADDSSTFEDTGNPDKAANFDDTPNGGEAANGSDGVKCDVQANFDVHANFEVAANFDVHANFKVAANLDVAAIFDVAANFDVGVNVDVVANFDENVNLDVEASCGEPLSGLVLAILSDAGTVGDMVNTPLGYVIRASQWG